MRVRFSSVCVSAGAVIRLVAGIVAAPLLVRLLGLERYGIWAVVNSIVAMCALLEFGISVALTTRLAASHARREKETSGAMVFTSLILVTVLGAIVSVALWASAPLLNAHLFPSYRNPVETRSAITLLSLSLIPRFWQTWAIAAESALMRYGLQMLIETCSAVATQVGTVIVVSVGGDLAAMAILWNWVTVLTVASHYVVLSQVFKNLRMRFSRIEARQLITFGLTNWAGSVGATIFSQADRIIVNAILGPAAAGLYSSATSIVVKINELSALPLRVLQPAISAAQTLSDRLRTRALFLQGTRLNGFIVFLMIAPVIFWAHPLARLLVGESHASELAPLLLVLCVVYGIFSLNAAAYWTAIGVGDPGINARWAISGSLLMCALLALLTAAFGLRGAAWANGGYILTLMINVDVVRRLGLKAAPYLQIALRPVGATLIMAGIATILNASGASFWVQMPVFLFSTPLLAAVVAGREFLSSFVSPVMPGMRRIFVKEQLGRAA